MLPQPEIDHWGGANLDAEFFQAMTEQPVCAIAGIGQYGDVNEALRVAILDDLAEWQGPRVVIAKRSVVTLAHRYGTLCPGLLELDDDVLLQHIIVAERLVACLEHMDMFDGAALQ